MAESNTILVTGFGPFDIHKVNASWEAVSGLPNEINGFKVIKECIPVAYQHVQTHVPLLWETYKPKLVIHVGVSSYTKVIQLETCANKTGYERKDINKTCPLNNQATCNDEKSQECIKTNLFTEKICEKLNETAKVKASLSHDAGRYLCEFVYYTSLNIDNDKTLFVHVPPLDNPYSKSDLTYALEEIIKCSLHLISQDETQKSCVLPSSPKIYKNGRAAAAF